MDCSQDQEMPAKRKLVAGRSELFMAVMREVDTSCICNMTLILQPLQYQGSINLENLGKTTYLCKFERYIIMTLTLDISFARIALSR